MKKLSLLIVSLIIFTASYTSAGNTDTAYSFKLMTEKFGEIQVNLNQLPQHDMYIEVGPSQYYKLNVAQGDDYSIYRLVPTESKDIFNVKEKKASIPVSKKKKSKRTRF